MNKRKDTKKAIYGIAVVLLLAVPLYLFGNKIIFWLNDVFGVSVTKWDVKFAFVILLAISIKYLFRKIDESDDEDVQK